MRQEALFLPSPRGRLFAVLRAPTAGVRGAIVHLPAFADEMNKARSVVAHASRVLADAGWAVLHLDPLGCGDSEGDFADATWEGWVRDAQVGAAWMRQHYPGQLWLWGLRSEAQPALSPSAASSVARWRQLGVRVETAAVTGPPFWNTVEIEECPQLAAATRDLLERLA